MSIEFRRQLALRLACATRSLSLVTQSLRVALRPERRSGGLVRILVRTDALGRSQRTSNHRRRPGEFRPAASAPDLAYKSGPPWPGRLNSLASYKGLAGSSYLAINRFAPVNLGAPNCGGRNAQVAGRREWKQQIVLDRESAAAELLQELCTCSSSSSRESGSKAITYL